MKSSYSLNIFFIGGIIIVFWQKGMVNNIGVVVLLALVTFFIDSIAIPECCKVLSHFAV